VCAKVPHVGGSAAARTAGGASIYCAQHFCVLEPMSDREPAELLIEPRWLLPVSPAGAVLEAHSVAVAGGRILAVGPAAELRERFAVRERIVRDQHALLPGLVNAHTRCAHALLRGCKALGARARGFGAGAFERHAGGADLVRDGTRLAIAEMLRAGITCFADLSALPAEAARTAAAAQVRALIALPVSDDPPGFGEDATTHLAKAEALWDEYRAHPRIGLYFAPLAASALSDAILVRLRRVADELDARIVLELNERRGPAQHAREAERQAAVGGVEDSAPWQPPACALPALERLARLGLLRPGFAAIGALECGAAGAALLERHGAALIGCPQAELRFGARPAALPLLAQDRTALGTDSPVVAGAFDLLAEMRTAALLSGLGAREALRLATLGGATALGLAAQIGSIEPGKAADLTCLDLSGLGCAHGGAVADAVVFGATRSQVSDVWTSGRAAVSGGRLMLFDETELEALPQLWARRLALEAAA
jgi:5-methylthioadenosine/S-adenosylhomocysteine deaminase